MFIVSLLARNILSSKLKAYLKVIHKSIIKIRLTTNSIDILQLSFSYNYIIDVKMSVLLRSPYFLPFFLSFVYLILNVLNFVNL